MNRKTIRILSIAILVVGARINSGFSQVKISNGQNNTPALGSLLDVEATNSGLLLPRVSLTNTTIWAPLTGVTKTPGMIVYNSNNSTSNGLTGKGLYIWRTGSTVWDKLPPKDEIIITASGVGVRKNTDVTVNANSSLTLAWDASDFSYQPQIAGLTAMWATTTPSKIIIPVDGMYSISVSVKYYSSTGGEKNLAICVNGNYTTPFNYSTRNGIIGGSGFLNSLGTLNMSANSQFYFNKGDYIEVRLNNKTTSSLTVAGNSSTGSIQMQVVQIPTVIQ